MEPYELHVHQDVLDDLHERLRRTRFAPDAPVDGWSMGMPSSYARELRDHWLHRYDWRATEAEVNGWPQLRTELDGCVVHLLDVRSPEPGARPLLLTHGWPGSLVEFLGMLGPLTDPAAHGGDAADAFHVVVPSLPGYGLSDAPADTGWSTGRIADAWVTLMDRLGHEGWVAHGGDWGSFVSTEVALRHPDAVAGIHLTMPIVAPTTDELTPQEQAARERLRHYRREGTGYAVQQATRPQTLAHALADSPMGQAAWIVEKFHEWTDHDGDHEQVVPRDRLLDDVMLYWLTNTGGSSARLYWESWDSATLDPVEVPTGVSSFPKEIVPASERFVAARFRDLRLFRDHERGGHFPALERPDVLVDDLRAFARTLR